jgi:hypothetical protein
MTKKEWLRPQPVEPRPPPRAVVIPEGEDGT